MTRFQLQLCLLTVLLCTYSRAILNSGLPSIDCTQHHHHGHSLALRHTATLELKPALQDHQAAASRSLTQVNGSLPQVESAPGISNNAAPPDHKPLFPVSGLEVAVLVIAGVVLFIAAGAGMGGGPVLVPLYLVAGLNNTAAVALSNSTILAGSVGNTLVNVFKRHPYKNKPLIDWDLVLLMEPATLIGAIAGSYINKLLPAWITSVLLMLLLALMTVRIAQRAARIYARETAARREEQQAAAAAAGLPPAQQGSAQLVQQQAQAARHGVSTLPSSSVYTAAHQAVPGAHAGEPNGTSSTAREASDVADSSVGGSLTDEAAAGVTQLLAAEGAAHVGPSDQLSLPSEPQPMYSSSIMASNQTTTQDSVANSRQASITTARQPSFRRHQQQQQQQEPQRGQHKQSSSTAHAATTAGHEQEQGQDRPPTPSMLASPFHGAQESRPASPFGGSSTPAGLASGQRSPYRGALSTVPSSVLLNVELEGGMSEAALQRLAMLEVPRVHSGGLDAADASLASMYGISSQHQHQQQPGQGQRILRGMQQQQQQQQQQHVGQGHQEPPSEAECRLAYAPPDHTRRDSWELAWEEEQQEAHTAADALTYVSTAAAGAAQGPAVSLDCPAGSSSNLRLATPPAARAGAGTAAAAAAAAGGGLGSKPRVLTLPATAAAGRTPISGFTASGVELADQRLAPGALAASTVHSQHMLSTAAAPAAPATAVSVSQPVTHAATAGSGRNASFSFPPTGDGNSSSNRSRSELLNPDGQAGVLNPGPKAPEIAAAARAQAVEQMLAAEARQLPLVPVALLLVMFAAVLLTSLLSKMAPCGSTAFWLVQWSVAPVLLGVWWFSRRRVLRKVALKKAAQLDFHGEVRWTPRKSLVFPAICSIAGIIAGMFGLGGAVVKTPLMLELGVHPSVTAATTQTMLLLTSSASSIVYAQLGDTPWDWAGVMLPMAFAATLAGQAAIDWLVKKVGRSSMVVLVLAVFFIVATCLSIFTMAKAAHAVVQNPALLGTLGKICR